MLQLYHPQLVTNPAVHNCFTCCSMSNSPMGHHPTATRSMSGSAHWQPPSLRESFVTFPLHSKGNNDKVPLEDF